ncbi:YceD family protein [Haliea sp. E17]|uniref:YceD family protein n=1 Tax=Haliea sp. E17 TaxID=3401576 RepID=UPI003AAEF152
MPQLRSLLASDEGQVEVQLDFSRDEENRPVVALAATAQVSVACQRCLGPMPLTVSGDTTLGIVWTDEQAKHLPKHLDPIVVPEEGGKLWDMVEEELILMLPAFSYHDTQDCKQILSGYSGQEPEEEAAPERPNPFEVLARLKPDKEPRS